MSEFQLDSDHILRVPELKLLPWLEHGFGTRHTHGWPPPERLVNLKQIHSALVLNADSADPGRLGEGDALVSSRPGMLVGIRTADCQPILLVDPVRRAVAAVHAGWRGTAAGIVVNAVRRMESDYGSNSHDLLAAIGPSIGSCCYEVGPEAAQQFQKFFPERNDLDRKTKIDLAEANRRQLIGAGLQESAIFAGAPCTFCSPDFYSYRRDRTEGRMYSAIGVAAGLSLPR